uniref:Uncharacterized protein n=1 Tax=Anguilla anguilla TaxID=7936 RepID=A0A0E9R4C7_ANGAN
MLHSSNALRRNLGSITKDHYVKRKVVFYTLRVDNCLYKEN